MITKTIAVLIHSGLKTHIQDQSITPTNFRTIKAIVRSPLNPIPVDAPLLFFSLSIFISFHCFSSLLLFLPIIKPFHLIPFQRP